MSRHSFVSSDNPSTHHDDLREVPNRSSPPKRRRSLDREHYERKRSRHDDNEGEQLNPNHRPTQIQSTNPLPRRTSRSIDNHSHQESTPVVTSQSNEMTTHIEQRPSPSFLLTDLLHRVIDAHAASYSDNDIHQHSTTTSIDLIAYAWVSPGQEIFSLPAAFSIQFGDFFDLIIPDETPIVGLTDSELDRIPTMIYSKKTSDEACTVCLSEYINGEKLKHLKCKHYFHSECIDPWLKTSTRCPICRGEQTN